MLDFIHAVNKSYILIMFALVVFDWFGDPRSAAGHIIINNNQYNAEKESIQFILKCSLFTNVHVRLICLPSRDRQSHMLSR